MTSQKKEIWRSSDVEAFRGFEYYRDGICRAFMDLIPEPERAHDWEFSGSVESLPVGTGKLNRVVATSHLVRRTNTEIANAPHECFYLNYKTRGECRIMQAGRETIVKPGGVGLFDSTVPFELEHRRHPDLAVSSFMLSHDDLRDRLHGDLPDKPILVSHHPSIGSLVRETAATLAREADHLPSKEAARMYNMLLDLVAMALKSDGNARVDVPSTRANALYLSAKNYLDQHHRSANVDVAEVARALNISVRYLHKLFASTEHTFGEYLLVRRLQSAAASLRAPSLGNLTIATIALQSGFKDPAHFHRTFKTRYGCTAGEWRQLQRI